MAWKVRERQQFAGYAHAVIVVITSLVSLILQRRDVNCDLYCRAVPAHPLDGWFQIGVAGDDDQIRAWGNM